MTEISRQYAEALFMLASEEQAAPETAQMLEQISDIFRNYPEYMDFLSAPSISKKERTSALDEAFSGSAPENIISFLKLLCERGHIGSFFECVAEFRKLCNEAANIKTAAVISAAPLTEKEKIALKAKLETLCRCTVMLSCSVDSSLIGGFTVELDGHIIDGSLKRKLLEIKEVIH